MAHESTIQPFQKGDILIGCTLLNDPDDDHAGDGRILQYDNDFNEKGVLWTKGTDHLVGGLTFGPDGNLWAFDSNAHTVIRVSPQGVQLPEIKFAERAFSNCCFAPDGTVLMGEHLVGNTIKLPPERPLGTTLSKIPGTDRFGDGHVFRFTLDGELIREYQTASNGGMTGFLGVTCTSLAADGRTLVYCSETGRHVYQYDIEADKQLPDLITHEPDSKSIALMIRHRQDGSLLYVMANFETGFALQHLSPDGEVLRNYPLPGRGWATVALTADPDIVLITNFFTGTATKMSLDSGEMIGPETQTGVERSLAGIAEYPG